MQRNSLLVLLAAVMMVIASCGHADKSAVTVPKDAGMVFQINTSSLSSKLSWKEIQETNWFKEAHSEADDSLAKKLLENPESSGIDTKGDLVFFLKKQGKGGYFAFEGLLKDPAAFEAFNKKMKPTATGSKDGDLSILKIEEGIATWKDGRFIYLFDAPVFNGFTGGSNSESKLSADSLISIAKTLYDLKGENTLGNDDRYTSLLKESGDLHLWVSAEHLYSGMMSGMLSMTKFSTLLEGNITAMTVNFDDGKISMKSKSYYNKEIGKLYEKYKMKKIDTDMLARIPSDSVVGVFAMNYPPDGLKEFLKVVGVDGMANSFLSEVGYSVDEFVKANKGDVLVAVSDLVVKSEVVTMPSYEEGGQPYTYTKTDPSVKVLFGVSINDKPAFDKMVGVVKAKVGEIPEGGGIPKISYTLNDKWFAAGNDEAQVNKFVAGGANNKQPFIGKLSGHPAGFYVDLQKIMKAFQPSTTDSTGKIVLAESLKVWEDILFTTGEVGGGSMSSEGEINFVDKKTNSLKQLNQYIDKVAGTKKKNTNTSF
jgi:major membrane immunogen (membrane-anchored lipoprotein)